MCPGDPLIRKVAAALLTTWALAIPLGALSVPGASSASAASTPRAKTAFDAWNCSIVVKPTVWVDSPYRLITAVPGRDCATNGRGSYNAGWTVRHPAYGPFGAFQVGDVVSDSLGFHDVDHYGTYLVEPSFAWDTDGNDLRQNYTSFVVKAGSRVSLSASRAGSYVTLRVGAAYYTPRTKAYRMWPNERVQLQYRACPSCSWTYLRNVYTASNGITTFRTSSAHLRYYRAVSTATSSVWGRTSVTILR